MKWLNNNFEQSRNVHSHMKNGIHSLMFRKVTALNIIWFPLSLLVDIGRVLTSQGVSPYKWCNWLQVATSLWKRPWWILQQFEWKGVKTRVFCSSQARKSHCRRRKRKNKEEERSRKEKEKKNSGYTLGCYIGYVGDNFCTKRWDWYWCISDFNSLIPSDAVWSDFSEDRGCIDPFLCF